MEIIRIHYAVRTSDYYGLRLKSGDVVCDPLICPVGLFDLCLAAPAFATPGLTVPLPYGSLRFADAMVGGPASYDGESLLVYEVPRNYNFTKRGLSADTVIRLYNATIPLMNIVNATQVNKLDGTKSADLTKAEIICRKQAYQVLEVVRRHLPGYEKAYISGMPAMIGVRETRRFEGVARLTKADCLAGRKRDDAIVHSASFCIDIHNPAGAGQAAQQETFKTGEAERVKPYDIPYGALVPKEVDGLLFAGRCISAEHEALASCRVMRIAMATGVGAGAAAAYAVQHGIDVRAVDARNLHLLDK